MAKKKAVRVESNLYPEGMCTGCNRVMKLRELFNHRLKNGDCPDEHRLFVLVVPK